MVTGTLGSLARGIFDALVRPREFVAAQTSAYARSRTQTLRQTLSLVTVYIVNLVTYAGPLTIAGFGVPAEGGTPPDAFAAVSALLGDPTVLWRFTLGFVQNSSYITVLAAVTLVTYHLGVVVTRNSAGFVQSLHTVVYSTSAYLAGMFTVVWYLTTTDGLAAARDFVLNVQRAAIYAVIDLVGTDFGLPGGRPDGVVPEALSQNGTVLLAVLALLVCYYLYSLYLGARLNHRMTRTSGVVVIVAVGLSPALYVLGSLIITLAGLPILA
jgi:hypothetical protein